MDRKVLMLLTALLSTAFSQMMWTCVTDSAPWEARFGHQMIVFHDTLWLFGGSGAARRSLNDIWYSTDGNSWVCATPAAQWSPRSSPRMFIFNDKLWLTGGFFWNNSYWVGLDDVWWSSDGANWTMATDSAGWEPRGIHTGLVFHDTMWVIGGLRNTIPPGDFYNDVWNSTDGVTWTCVAESTPWAPRGGQGSMIFNDSLWLVCGYNLADVWCSGDVRSWALAQAGVPWAARYGQAAVAFHDTMWAMGGYDAIRGRFYNDVWWSTDGANWTQAVQHADWADRHFPAGVIYQDKIWLAGGTPDYTSGFRDVWFTTGLTGVEQTTSDESATSYIGARLVHGVLSLPPSLLLPPTSLFSLDGRKVLDLKPGPNDVSALSPGIYFVRSERSAIGGQPSAVTKVIIAR